VRILVLIGLAALAGCSFSESRPRYDTGLEGLAIEAVEPGTVVPGTVVVVSGRSFVDAPWGETSVVLAGRLVGASVDQSVEARLAARFVDFEHLEIEIGDSLGSLSGDFSGTARVEVDSAVDGQLHVSGSIDVSLVLREELTPGLDDVAQAASFHVNDEIVVEGADMLLGGDEGTTFARVEGCFALADETGELGECAAVGPVDLAVTPGGRFDRARGSFRFAPEIAGIRAGEFRGSVLLINKHASGAARESGALEAVGRMAEVEVGAVAPEQVSLGQYLEIEGGGFVGGATDQVTLLHLVGELAPAESDEPILIDTLLVPEFVSGRSVRYVMNEDDDLGEVLGLRGAGGRLTGQVSPIVSFREDEVTGPALAIDLRVGAVVQVVYLHFTAQYASSLQHFGLRAADAEIRRRVIEVVERDYRALGVEIRTERPTDFSLFAEVEVGGPDPNGLGLLGYDNTPGKDVGNVRLYDRIGGVNATTQADGFPGYGGVFVESLFTFSEHPNGLVPVSAGVDPMFDDLFDPFRPDQDGEPLLGDELAGFAPLSSGASCPASDRQGRIECAVWVLGSLIGTTVSHELGHSLGLANPGGGDVHILTDEPNRLMEAGGGRSFRERAEVDAQGPGMFCDQEYSYLRGILPGSEPIDSSPRPDCR
jgi:hypothetical protein